MYIHIYNIYIIYILYIYIYIYVYVYMYQHRQGTTKLQANQTGRLLDYKTKNFTTT